eukprot:COSAG01_NODE_24843_length_764_cov_1.425564_1_plen_64_part_00
MVKELAKMGHAAERTMAYIFERRHYQLRNISMATEILDWLRFTYVLGEVVSVMMCDEAGTRRS